MFSIRSVMEQWLYQLFTLGTVYRGTGQEKLTAIKRLLPILRLTVEPSAIRLRRLCCGDGICMDKAVRGLRPEKPAPCKRSSGISAQDGKSPIDLRQYASLTLVHTEKHDAA